MPQKYEHTFTNVQICTCKYVFLWLRVLIPMLENALNVLQKELGILYMSFII